MVLFCGRFRCLYVARRRVGSADRCGAILCTSAGRGQGFTRVQMQEMRDTFNLFDVDRDGSIDRDEFGTVMRALGQNPSEEEIDALLARCVTVVGSVQCGSL